MDFDCSSRNWAEPGEGFPHGKEYVCVHTCARLCVWHPPLEVSRRVR